MSGAVRQRGPSLQRLRGQIAGVDEPRRHDNGDTGGLQVYRVDSKCEVCCLRFYKAAGMGGAVPSGGVPLAAGHSVAEELRGRHLRKPAGLERRLLCGDYGEGTEGATGRRQGDSWTLRRRGLKRCRRIAQQGNRQEPHLYLRRPWYAAQERVPRCDGGLQVLGSERYRCGREREILRRPGRSDRS